MGKYNGAVITSAGQNVIAQAIAGTELTWTVMRTSSVAIAEGTDLTTLTSLTGIEQTSNITDASVYGDNIVQVSARFSNTGIATVYYIQTVGIYGQLAGGAETLIAIMTAVTPDEMPVYDSDSPSAFIFNTQMTVQNADTVNMTVNDTGTATVADLKRKVDTQGGDISNTVVNTVTASTAEYPVPAAGDSTKTIIGKIVKFCADIVKTFTGATSSAAGKKGLVPAPVAGQQNAYMRGDGQWVQLQNNATTTQDGYALNAKMGKTLQDQITSLNDSLDRVVFKNINILYGSPITLALSNNFRGLLFTMTSSADTHGFYYIRSNINGVVNATPVIPEESLATVVTVNTNSITLTNPSSSRIATALLIVI